MKETGIVRKLDELGRLVIPIEFRNIKNLKVKDTVEIYLEGNDIIIDADKKDKNGIGIFRKLDELGRVVIPIEIRETIGLKEGDKIEFYTKGDKLIIRKYEDRCIYCGKQKKLQMVLKKPVCPLCIKNIKHEWQIEDK